MHRIHRIGQTRPTTVYRIVVEETVEERVLEIQDQKRDLHGKVFNEVVDGRRARDSHTANIARLLRR